MASLPLPLASTLARGNRSRHPVKWVAEKLNAPIVSFLPANLIARSWLLGTTQAIKPPCLVGWADPSQARPARDLHGKVTTWIGFRNSGCAFIFTPSHLTTSAIEGEINPCPRS